MLIFRTTGYIHQKRNKYRSFFSDTTRYTIDKPPFIVRLLSGKAADKQCPFSQKFQRSIAQLPQLALPASQCLSIKKLQRADSLH
jgi:hypothetical protein